MFDHQCFIQEDGGGVRLLLSLKNLLFDVTRGPWATSLKNKIAIQLFQFKISSRNTLLLYNK